jgi:hypothetical protein
MALLRRLPLSTERVAFGIFDHTGTAAPSGFINRRVLDVPARADLAKRIKFGENRATSERSTRSLNPLHCSPDCLVRSGAELPFGSLSADSRRRFALLPRGLFTQLSIWLGSGAQAGNTSSRC